MKELHKGKWITLCEQDGYEYVKRNNNRGAVFVVAVTKYNELIVVRQLRKPLGTYVWEPPAGLIDDGETARECAIRELEEETGYRGDFVYRTDDITSSPGMSAEKLQAVLIVDCERVSAGGGLASENEYIEVASISLKDTTTIMTKLGELSKTGIIDMKLYAALGFASL